MIIDAEGKNTGQTFTRRYRAEGKKKTGDIFCELLWGNFICPQSIILKKSLCDSTGFDDRIAYAVDYRFLIKLAKQHHFCFIAEPLVKYRVHSDNISSRNSKLWVHDMIRLYVDELEQMGEIMPRKIRGALFYRLSKYFLMRNHRKFSRYYLWQAIRQRPWKVSYLRRLLLPFPDFDSDDAGEESTETKRLHLQLRS